MLTLNKRPKLKMPLSAAVITLNLVSVLSIATMYALIMYWPEIPKKVPVHHLYNYLHEITKQNAEYQYRNARMMICSLKAETIGLFGYIEWKTVQVALGNAMGLGISFLLVSLLIIFGTMGFYIYRMAK